MESGVEHGYLRNTRERGLNRSNTFQVSGIMQRSQINALLNLCLHFRRDKNGFIEFLASMHYAVAYCVDLLQIFDATEFGIYQRIENELNTYCMLRHRFLDFYLLSVRQFYQQERIRQTDFLHTALRHYLFALHLKELVLDTTASAVQNQDFHVYSIF